MRSHFLMVAMLFSASPAFAQSYQQYQPQQEANVTNYPVPPTTYPQPAYIAPQPQPQPVAPQTYYDTRDSVQPVVNDVRQMNF